MKKQNNIVLIFLFLFLSLGCDDILEEDITDNVMQITVPLEGAKLIGNSVQFSWEYIDGAKDYRVQVTNSNQINVVDSLVKANSFTYTLDSGTYQWRIRGENFAYKTAYIFPVNFSIEESDDLSNQIVDLEFPTDNFYENEPSKGVVFSWKKLGKADFYNFILIKKLNGETIAHEAPNITATRVTVDDSDIDEDAEYIWKVMAINTLDDGTVSETEFSEQSLFVDTVAPNQPILSSPVDLDEIAPSVVTFNWQNGTDTGNVKSPITSFIEIFKDIDFTIEEFSSNTSSNSIQYEFKTVGTYYWRVTAKDVAKNISDHSIVRSIIVK
ncbi:hypothetical protein A8C32_10420 [Flavivirga aquatica]|uniref:Fibronectin type-III domain-containing protein n=1 Tax=Flavivirga aquatica TaxID=1849968 RepID=A0A1E5TCR4_9FLAO|nr:pilus assembly protein [Flavivirga aquatica]OEK09140.1 hypothetical protein A8C32_10420 [Flavivirga aquatica]